ncbi:hypothetical protein ACQJBY_053668 [Aegilops geniculata]
MQTLHFSDKTHSKVFRIPSLALALVLLICLVSPGSSCTEQEEGSLLQFLAGLSQDGGLSATWRNGTDCCKWEGITCRQDGTVTAVLLPSKGLQGHISQTLGFLTGLQHVDLSHNSLSGGLPPELMSSSSITILDVSFNQLNGTLQELPSTTPARPLQIPTQFCNTTPSLTVLELCFNKFSGSIPPSLGNCSKLRELGAGYNKLSGVIPDELFNATSLEYLSFANNDLYGVLDRTHITKLRNLVILDLGGNQFSGKIPDYIGQLKRLEEFHLNNNNMSGELPSALSNCTNLITIDLKSNKLSGELTNVNFSSLPKLKTLDLWSNNFTGTVPESIYSCSNLTALRLSNNHLHGQLSSRIGNLKYLSFLSLGKNNFTNITNTLQILKSSKNLTTLLIGHNFGEEILSQDETINGFGNLQVLDIQGCKFSGRIPVWISRAANLQMLLLCGNRLTGPIPGWISSLSHLFYMDVSSNSLTGEIPLTLTEMPMLKSTDNATDLDSTVFELPVYNGPALQYRVVTSFPAVLNLSNNNFTGVIPAQIGQLKVLAVLDFSFNKLAGQIPQSVCNLTNLQVLDLSSNNLTGAIPASLNRLNYLSAFNISNNDLEGPIPSGGQFDTFQNSSFNGNPKLCGSMLTHKCDSASIPPSSTKPRHKKALFVIAFGVFFGGIAVLLLLGRFIVLTRINCITTRDRRENDGDVEATSFYTSSEQTLVVMRMPQGKTEENKLKFADILKATNNFDKENIIGCGGYGLVYKAELPDGSKLAIKKLNGEMCLMEREFSAEVDALSMAQHDNLVPLWGYCIQGNSRFLVYSYMENGSLDDWLHNRYDDAISFLDWPTRLKIAQGASMGLSYIHDVCKPQIVHRDIKSSNILLDKEFKAYVADFGLARLILPDRTHVTTELVGTMGYIPPEYGQAWVATLRGDMYSFGVVLLELLTGRRPVTVLSTSKELVPWVLQMRSEGKQTEVLDPTLQGRGYEEQMLKVLETACKCVDNNQFRRPAISDVVSSLASVEADP